MFFKVLSVAALILIAATRVTAYPADHLSPVSLPNPEPGSRLLRIGNLDRTPPSGLSRKAPDQATGAIQNTDPLAELLRKGNLSLGMVLSGLAIAFGFGAMHALSPGHGKTIVAAYLVGSRGTIRHAMLLGGMVTLTHTASVFLLGLGTLFLSRYVVPDKIIPVLSVVSGLMIVLVGASMFYRRLQQAVAGDHQHEHDHAHGHHHSHSHGDHHHGPGDHTHVVEGEVTMGSLMGLAVSGGLVPCPSALVLLLSAIALGRITLGLALLTSFSLGLSLVLIAIGCMVLYAKNLLPDRSVTRNHSLVKMMPVISAGIITILGLLMTAVALGWVRPSWS